MENKRIKRIELLHIVNKLHGLFFTSSSENREDLALAIKIASCSFRWATCEGGPGLKRAKAMSNAFVRHLMGTPLESIPLSNQNKRLLNKALSRCNSHLDKVFWVSVFSSFRLFYTEPDVDTSTITSRFKGNLSLLLNTKYLGTVDQVNKSFRKAIKANQNWSPTFKWHISGASGPNGRVAYTQYLNDLRALRYSWLRVGLYVLFYSIPYCNNKEAVKALKNAFYDSTILGDKNSIHSRLCFLSDKGGKTRVVALGDILSQSILKSVHQRCNLYLRHLIQDGTFDQDRSRRFIKKMTEDSLSPLASIDLTAATDRMPVLLQVYVLVSLRILTPLQGFGWWWVTTRRDFTFFVKGKPKRVRYKVGQPMGLLSSWPAMAISHHFLVRWAYSASGHKRPEYAKYSVLGDDLTLLGHGVAGEYLNLLKCFGMDYSPEKTYISNGVAEFAKSLFCHGEDLTPFPLALLRFNRNTIVSNTLAVISQCKRIGIPLTASSLIGVFPKRWRNLVLLAALSPTSPRYALDLQPRVDQWTFLQFIWSQKIKSFGRIRTAFDSIHAFVTRNPVYLNSRLSSPFIQIGSDNSESYPVRTFSDPSRLLDSNVYLGYNWYTYCSKAWPDGPPLIGDKRLIPGAAWEVEKKKEREFRSSLTMLNKRLPGYFFTRCSSIQVGE